MSKVFKIWWQEEIEFVRANSRVLSRQVMANMLSVTRNAISGIAHRNGISCRSGVPLGRRKGSSPQFGRTFNARKIPGQKALAEEAAAPPPGVEPLNIPLLATERHHCRSITGSDEDGRVLFCGHNVVEGYSYCPYHKLLYYTKPTKRGAQIPYSFGVKNVRTF